MANAAPDGNPTMPATAVAEKLTVRESATMCASSVVPRAAQTSTTSHLPRSPATLPLVDQPEGTPTQPARYYRQKAAEARRAAEGVTTRAIKARLDVLARGSVLVGWCGERAAQRPDSPA